MRSRKYDNKYSSLVLQAMIERHNGFKDAMYINKRRRLLPSLGFLVTLVNGGMHHIHCTGPKTKRMDGHGQMRKGFAAGRPKKGAYSAHGPEPGVAGGQIVQGQGANNGELPYSKEAAEPQPRIPSEAGDIEHVEHRMLNRPSEE